MSSKRQKMTAKRGRASEEPARIYDHDKLVNESMAEKFYSDPRARPDPVGGSKQKSQGRLAEVINQIPLAILFLDPGTPV